MPSGITFDTDSYSIKPEFRTTLDNIASTLGSYNQTYVDVYGHTDSTGADASNITLSRNRAESVASYLSTHGLARARIGPQISEEGRVGKEWYRTCRSRWQPAHK